jgi:hypothetical protein
MKTTAFIVIGAFAFPGLFAQSSQDDAKVEVITPVSFHISKPLSTLFETTVTEEEEIENRTESLDRLHRIPQKFLHQAEDGAEYGNDPATIQRSNGTRQMMAPLTNWAGQSGGGCPPDPSGAAGPNHYVQAVNATPFKVFNKTTGSIIGTVKNIGSLWSPATDNMGDPIIMYDKYADRWFLSQFGEDGSSSYAYVAISTSPDPTGTYYTYSFVMPEFPDYLKFSIWSDGYYMTFNGSTSRVFCFERDEMIIGNPSARAISKTFNPGNVSGFYIPLPGDADGGLPPFGTPLPFFSYSENSWGGGNIDAIKIWSMSVSWGATPTATIAAPTILPTAAFDGTYNSGWNDISQASGTQKLDGIGGILLFRAQWRKWTTYNSVVLNWGVKLSNTQRSIKWVELRQDQGTGVWSLYQEGIYAPDSLNRWVGSIAMDDNGSIALCYAVAGPNPSTAPSLRYTGRLQSDPLGQMTFTEQTAIAGSGVLTACSNRFGDYSQTSLDPNGLTFWHTGEYIVSGNPRTRIYSFQLPLITTGIGEYQNQSIFTVYQSDNKLNFKADKLPSNKQLVVDLFEITGKQISGKKIIPVSNSLETTIDIDGLAKGTYLIRVGNNDFQKIIKTIIN